MQDELGLLDRASTTRYMRAVELGADCHAGIFMRGGENREAPARETVDGVRAFLYSAGDRSASRSSHGTGSQRVRWFDTGLASPSIDACDDVFRVEHALAGVPHA